MKISKEARKLSKRMFNGSFSDGKLDGAKVSAIARTVIDQKPRKYTEILKNYQRLIRVEVAKRHAVIESAAELANDMRNQLLGTLRAKYGADLTTEFKVSPELIGGLACCDAVICSDGGAMHIAAGLGKPIACFFADSEVERWRPWGVRHVVLKAGTRDVKDVSVEDALKAANELLDLKP